MEVNNGCTKYVKWHKCHPTHFMISWVELEMGANLGMELGCFCHKEM